MFSVFAVEITQTNCVVYHFKIAQTSERAEFNSSQSK